MENSSLYEQVKKKSQHLEALVKIIRDMASLLDRDVLLPKIAGHATKLLEMHCTSFRLVEGEFINLVHSTHGEDVNLRPRLRLGESISGRVIQENRVIAIRNVLKDPSLIKQHQETMGKAGYRAYLGIPLRVGSRVIGTINLQSKEERDFSEEEIGLISAFADQAAIAIENARLYENLKKSNNLIRRADRLSSLGILTAGLAHEVRNPLVAIRTFAQLLPKRYQDEDFRNQFQSLVLKEVDRICGLVNDLLGFARHSTPKVDSEDVNEIVECIARILETGAKERSIAIHLHLDPNLPNIPVDKEQIKQVVMNIILNAIQSTQDGGKVEIRTRLFNGDGSKRFFQIEVKDTGHGIKKKDVENIFDPFFTTRDTGCGLGLSVSHQLVREHDGHLDVQSEFGKGTTFFINLPERRAVRRTMQDQSCLPEKDLGR